MSGDSPVRQQFLLLLGLPSISTQQVLDAPTGVRPPAMFKRQEPIRKDEDHPELPDGAAEWVRKMRAEAEARFEN